MYNSWKKKYFDKHGSESVYKITFPDWMEASASKTNEWIGTEIRIQMNSAKIIIIIRKKIGLCTIRMDIFYGNEMCINEIIRTAA